jgi:hypothetical protein
MRRKSTVKAVLKLGLLIVGLGLGTPADAELLATSLPVKVVASGGYCDQPPDEIVAAPEADGGQYEHNFRPFDYVVKGDRFPAQIRLGIGVRVKISGYGPGRSVRVLVVPPEGRTGAWDMRIGPDGQLEFGRLPAIGGALPEGRYLLSALDGGKYLFTFALTLEGEAEESLCVPVS